MFLNFFPGYVIKLMIFGAMIVSIMRLNKMDWVMTLSHFLIFWCLMCHITECTYARCHHTKCYYALCLGAKNNYLICEISWPSGVFFMCAFYKWINRLKYKFVSPHFVNLIWYVFKFLSWLCNIINDTRNDDS